MKKSKIYDPKRDIINTLSYKKIFNQPLTIYQLIYYGHCYFINLSEVHEALGELIRRSKIKFKNNKYFLSSMKFKEVDKLFEDSKKYFLELEKIVFIFDKIPFIQMVGVTGSLAAYHFNEETDDIDLFIICTRDRVWITRFLIVVIFKFLNIYVNNKHPQMKLCPNIYISDSSMSWDSSKRNIYVANEIVMMQPIFQRNETYFKFLYLNNWILDFIPNFVINEVSINSQEKELTLLDLLEKIIMFLQKVIMKNKSGSEVLNKNFIHFLKIDHSERILDSFSKLKS